MFSLVDADLTGPGEEAIAGRFESPSGTRRLRRRRCRLPAAERISPRPGSSNKNASSFELAFLLELLGRFELPTSSLPRMRSTY